MRLLIITDDTQTLSGAKSYFDESYEVETVGNRLSAKEKSLRENYDVVFYDLGFLLNQGKSYEESFIDFKKTRPGSRVIILSDPNKIRETMSLIKIGADDYLTYPIDPLEIKTVTEKTILRERQVAELEGLRDEYLTDDYLNVVKTQCPKMQNLYDMVKEVAPTNSTVLLNGETGVGKGVLARLIHRHSTRKDKHLVHVHCGAISENLIESELFGHEKGAFTGAIKRKLGKFELANNGTIFLDEISTLSSSAQIKLLQVLQDSSFQRVGGEVDIKVSVRVVAATNENLKSLVELGQFRNDLFFRLNVFPIELPPLRERTEDLEHIVDVFLRRLRSVFDKQIGGIQSETIEALKKYDWPGNIRELENVIERAYILEKSSTLTSASFPVEMFKDLQDQAVLPLNLNMTLSEARNRNNENFELQYLKELLTMTKGQIGLTAQKAGISVRQLNNLMNKHKIYKDEFKVRLGTARQEV